MLHLEHGQKLGDNKVVKMIFHLKKAKRHKLTQMFNTLKKEKHQNNVKKS